jgi:hypothetical protein
MKRYLTVLGAVIVSMAAFSSCSNDPTLGGATTTGANIQFQQIDREGLPGLKTVFQAFAKHDGYNRTSPTNDASGIGGDISSFMTGYGRSSAVASAAATTLVPDVLVADFNVSGDASLLGVQTLGKLNVNCQGSRNGTGQFGGRSLLDDAGAAMLGIAFGNTVPTTFPSPPADDNAEYTGTGGKPNLANDNVSCNAIASQFTFSQFPYLPNPI